MNGSLGHESEELLADLVHELRQPLSTLEYSACYLQMLLGEAPEAVQQQLRILQQQLDLANRLVDEATRRPSFETQHAPADQNLDFTKSEIAAVT